MIYLVQSFRIPICPVRDVLLIASTFLLTDPFSLDFFAMNKSICPICSVVDLPLSWVKRAEHIAIIVEVCLVSLQIFAEAINIISGKATSPDISAGPGENLSKKLANLLELFS